jgi:6-pyruvoyltetrahydropterin/6-carboxytetrahydropterin synthase
MSMTSEGTVVEFGAFKRAVRSWIDTQLDNGAMLGAADALLPAFMADGSKTFRFGATGDAREPERLASDLPWPTVEAVAIVIARAAGQALATIRHAKGSWISEVLVTETRVNSASWRAEPVP